MNKKTTPKNYLIQEDSNALLKASGAVLPKSWAEMEREISTPAERIMNRFSAELACAFFDVRDDNGYLDENRIANLSGVSRDTVHRMATCEDIRLENIVKILFTLGKKLAIVPLEDGDIY